MSQDGNIKQLNIKINTNAESATRGLEQLASAMNNLTFGNVSGLKDFTKDLKALAKVDFSGNNIGNSLSNLQAQITGLNFEASGLTTLVDSIKKLGSKSVDNAIGKMPLLADAMTQLFNKLSVAPVIRQDVIDMTKALADFSSQGAKVGSAGKKIANGLDKAGKSAKKNKGLIAQFFAGFNAGNFAGNFTANLVAPLIRGIGSSISEAMRTSLEYASDLVETQNVIERTFGESKDVIEDFSKTALNMYGMNELEAKKMTGTFQAMGTALGETKERMSSVSTSLSALVGDYASFFNKNVADVANDFTAIFTGQTKAMRKYGIDLTNAMLQDFANSQGWNVQVKSLSQYNKAIIRYNYLVSRSQDILGDFQRTQGSYANQVKLVNQQFKELFGTLGQIGTAILTPILQVMNELISKIRQFAEQLVAFLGIDNFKSISGGAVEGLEDLADGFDDVAEAEKKAKTYSTGIDELNVLKPNESASKGSGLQDLGANWDTDWWDKLEKGKKDFTDFTELIQNIYNTLKPTIDAFKEFYSNVLEPIGKVAFDGLTSLYEDFLKPIAKFTFGDALPFLFNTLADIGSKINWGTITSGLKNLIQVLGKATTGIGKGIINFFKSISPVLKPVIAKTINLIAKAFESLTKVLNKIPVKVFDLIGRGLGVIMTYKTVNGIINNLSKSFRNLGNSLMATSWRSDLLQSFPKIRDAIFGAGSALDKFGVAIQGISSTIAIISAIAMAIYQVYDYCKKLEEQRLDNFLSGYGTSLERLNEVKTKLQEVNAETDALLNGASDADVQATYIKNLADEYFKLADKEQLTNEEQKDLIFYAGKLVEAIPELEKNIDTATGAYKGNRDEIQNVIEKTMELMRLNAVKDMWEQQAKAVAEAQVQQRLLEQSLEDTEEEYQSLTKEYKKSVQEYANSIKNTNALTSMYAPQKSSMLAQLEKDREDTNKLLAELKPEIDEGQKKLDALMRVQKDFATELANQTAATTKAIGKKTTSSVSSANESIEKAGEQLVETGKQQIKNANESLKTEMENILEEDRATMEIGAKVSEEDLNKIPEETKGKVANTNEELTIDENKLKVGVSIDSTGLDTGLDTMKQNIETKGEEITGSMTNVGTNAVNALNTTMLNGNTTYIETLIEKINAQLKETQRLSNIKFDWESGNAEAQKQAGYIKAVAEEYFKLADAENLSNKEQELLKYYAGELVSLVPDLQGKIDLLTGAYIGNKEELSKLINEQIRMVQEEKPNIEVGAKVNEEDINKIPEETKEKVATINEELSQEENKLKVSATLDSTELDTSLDTMKQNIETKGEEITGSMTNVGTNAVNALNTTMLNGNTTYIETLTENATAIKTTFEDAKIGLGIKGNTSTVFEEYGLAVVNGFKAGIEKNKQISLNAVSVWVKDIMRTFVGNDVEGVNYNVWFEYAHKVVQGFADGINAFAHIAKDAIKKWVAEIMATFEEEMDIESPSKVFKGYGYYTVAGFNKGIEDNQSTTTSIIKDWVGDIEKQMQAIENFNIDMSNTIKGLDNLTAKVNTQVDMSGFYGELEKASTMGMTSSLNSYAENRQAIEVNIPNITLEVDSREIARANYKGQKELGYQIRK